MTFDGHNCKMGETGDFLLQTFSWDVTTSSLAMFDRKHLLGRMREQKSRRVDDL